MRIVINTILLLLFAVQPAISAIAVDATSTINDDYPTSLNRAHATSGTDRLMLVGGSIWNNDYEGCNLMGFQDRTPAVLTGAEKLR